MNIVVVRLKHDRQAVCVLFLCISVMYCEYESIFKNSLYYLNLFWYLPKGVYDVVKLINSSKSFLP